MPLIVVQRRDKGFLRKCEKCQHLSEIKDDAKVYPKTVAIVCNAPRNVYMGCFDYMWLMVRSKLPEREAKELQITQPLERNERLILNESITKLREIAKKWGKMRK